MRKKRRSAVIANTQQPDEEEKEKEKDLMMKAQLHGESKQMHELEGRPATELDTDPVLERPALEPVGSELSAKEQVFFTQEAGGWFVESYLGTSLARNPRLDGLLGMASQLAGSVGRSLTSGMAILSCVNFCPQS
jgi:hypothetical protein